MPPRLFEPFVLGLALAGGFAMPRRQPEAPPIAVSCPKTAELLERLHVWAKPLYERPDFRAFNRRKLRAARDFYDDEPDDGEGDFEMPAELSAEYDAVMQFYYLYAACDRLQGMHLYFRRYPFRAGEMRKVEHLQNMFDLYVNGVYVVEERIKKYLTALKPLVPVEPAVGKVLKRFGKDFEAELRPRHDSTHFRPYNDIIFDRLWMSELMGTHEARGEAWRREHDALYRRTTAKWAAIVQRRSRDVLIYLEAVAGFTLEHAAFLRPSAEAA